MDAITKTKEAEKLVLISPSGARICGLLVTTTGVYKITDVRNSKDGSEIEFKYNEVDWEGALGATVKRYHDWRKADLEPNKAA